MNLVAYAVPFFVLAMVFELAYGVARKRNTYRLNDSVSSLFLGLLSQTRRFVTLGVGAYVYHLISQYFSLPLMDASHWFTWVLATVLYDFCYYWLHRMGHERTLLWAAHVAHHQSEDYNLSTALRQTSTGFLFSWLFYIPMYLLGIPAEVVLTVGSINLIYQFWVHTEHVPKMGWYEWVFVTPSNHRVHHAQNTIYMDRNYGGLFIIWDRLFGTFQDELAREPCIYGIRGPLHSWNPVRAITHIYVDMCRDSWRAQTWGDKLRVWVARTGWRPADVAARYPQPKPDLDNFQKYDPKVSPVVAVYAFLQLLVLVVLLNFMENTGPGYWAGVSLWAFMLATMVTTALWLQNCTPQALKRWELLRLTVVAGLVAVGWIGAIHPVLGTTTLVYIGLNLLVLPLLGRAATGTLAEPGADEGVQVS